jgi:hypothetical protein
VPFGAAAVATVTVFAIANGLASTAENKTALAIFLKINLFIFSLI